MKNWFTSPRSDNVMLAYLCDGNITFDSINYGIHLSIRPVPPEAGSEPRDIRDRLSVHTLHRPRLAVCGVKLDGVLTLTGSKIR